MIGDGSGSGEGGGIVATRALAECGDMLSLTPPTPAKNSSAEVIVLEGEYILLSLLEVVVLAPAVDVIKDGRRAKIDDGFGVLK